MEVSMRSTAVEHFLQYCIPGRTFDDALSLWILDCHDYSIITQLPNFLSAYKNAYFNSHPEYSRWTTREANLFGNCRFLSILLQRAMKIADPDPIIDYIITPILLLFPRESTPFLLEPINLYNYLTFSHTPDISRQLKWTITYHFDTFVNLVFLPLLFYNIEGINNTTTCTHQSHKHVSQVSLNTSPAPQPSTPPTIPTPAIPPRISDISLSLGSSPTSQYHNSTPQQPQQLFSYQISQVQNWRDAKSIILENPTTSNFPISLPIPTNENLYQIHNHDMVPENGGPGDDEFLVNTDIPSLWANAGAPIYIDQPSVLASSVSAPDDMRAAYLVYLTQCEKDWRMVSTPTCPVIQDDIATTNLLTTCSSCGSNNNPINTSYHPIPKASDTLKLIEAYQSSPNTKPPPPNFSTYPFHLSPTNSSTDMKGSRPLDIFATFNITRPTATNPSTLKEFFFKFTRVLRLVPFFHPNFEGISPARYHTILDYVTEWCLLMLKHCPEDGFMINALLNRFIPEFVEGHRGLLRSYGYDTMALDVLTPQAFIIDQSDQIRRKSTFYQCLGDGNTLRPKIPFLTPILGQRTNATLVNTNHDTPFDFGDVFQTPLHSTSRLTAAIEPFQSRRCILILHHAILPFILSTPALFCTPSLLCTSISNSWSVLKRHLDQLSTCPHPCEHCHAEETAYLDQQFSMLEGESRVEPIAVNSTSPSSGDIDEHTGNDGIGDQVNIRPLSAFASHQNTQQHLATHTKGASTQCNHPPHSIYWKYVGDEYLSDLINNASFWSFKLFPAFVTHALELEYQSFVVQSSRRFASANNTAVLGNTTTGFTTTGEVKSCSRSLEGRVFYRTSSGIFLDDDKPALRHQRLPAVNRCRVLQALFEVLLTIQTLDNPAIFRNHLESLINQIYDYYFPLSVQYTISPPQHPSPTLDAEHSSIPDHTFSKSYSPTLLCQDDEKTNSRASCGAKRVQTLQSTSKNTPIPTPLTSNSIEQPLPTIYQYLIGYIYSENSRSLSNFILSYYLILPFFIFPHDTPRSTLQGPSTFIKFLMIVSKLNVFNYQHVVSVDLTLSNRYGYFVLASQPILNPVITHLNSFNMLMSKVLSAIISFPESPPISLLHETGNDHDEIVQIHRRLEPLLIGNSNPPKRLAGQIISPLHPSQPIPPWMTQRTSTHTGAISNQPCSTPFHSILSNITSHHPDLHELQMFAVNAFLSSTLEVVPSYNTSPPRSSPFEDSYPHWLYAQEMVSELSQSSSARVLPPVDPRFSDCKQHQNLYPFPKSTLNTIPPPEVIPTRKPSHDYTLLTIHPQTESQSSLLFLSSIPTRRARHPTTTNSSWFPPYAQHLPSNHTHLPGKSRRTAISSTQVQQHHASLSTRPYSIHLATNLPIVLAIANNRVAQIGKTFGQISRYYFQHQQMLRLMRQNSPTGDDNIVEPQPPPNQLWTQRQLDEYQSFLELLDIIDSSTATSLELYINTLCFVLMHQHEPDFILS